VGGPTDLLVIAHSRDDLIEIAQLTHEAGLTWRVFGGLTNVLLPDGGLRGVVVLNHAREVRFDEDCRVYAGAGAIVVSVARAAIDRGWGGLTWAIGLPGTIGGAVVNNAGAFGGEISRTLTSAEILGPAGVPQVVEADWFDFKYRSSRLKGTGHAWVVLSATFQLRHQAAPHHLAQKAEEYTERRRRTQPPGKTLGSTFKNPPGDYAGRLIDAAGLKGTRQGGFAISEQHANFFINEGGGTAADYQALIRLVQNEVMRQFGVELEPEIEIIPEEPGFTDHTQ